MLLRLSVTHEFIPADGSGKVSVTDIGVGEYRTGLACLHQTQTLDGYTAIVWYFNGTDINSASASHLGWTSSYLVWYLMPAAIIYREANKSAIEGVFKCCLLDKASNSVSSSVSVGIYYPSEYIYTQIAITHAAYYVSYFALTIVLSAFATIEVVSGREKLFRVSCSTIYWRPDA